MDYCRNFICEEPGFYDLSIDKQKELVLFQAEQRPEMSNELKDRWLTEVSSEWRQKKLEKAWKAGYRKRRASRRFMKESLAALVFTQIHAECERQKRAAFMDVAEHTIRSWLPEALKRRVIDEALAPARQRAANQKATREFLGAVNDFRTDESESSTTDLVAEAIQNATTIRSGRRKGIKMMHHGREVSLDNPNMKCR